MVDTVYHVALVRNGNDFDIYLDGVSVASVTDADAIPNYTGNLTIGMRSDSTLVMGGFQDEFAMFHVARYTANFTPPVSQYSASIDEVFISRGKFNTEAVAHEAEDRFQQGIYYDAEDAADIIYDLFGYAGIPPSYINLATWQAETTTFLGVLYSAFISEPTAVNALSSELVEQAGLVIWWEDESQLIKLQVLRGVAEFGAFTEDNVEAGTLVADDQPDKRMSRIQVYFGKINPLKNNDEASNYRSSVRGPDDAASELAEEDYGSPAIKTIYSRWIPALGRTVAERLIEILFSRYRDPPRRFRFEGTSADCRPRSASWSRLRASIVVFAGRYWCSDICSDSPDSRQSEGRQIYS